MSTIILPTRGETWIIKNPEGFDFLDFIGKDSPFSGFMRGCLDFQVKIVNFTSTGTTGVVSLRAPDCKLYYTLSIEDFLKFFRRYS